MIINRNIPIGMKELCFHASLNKMHCLRTHSFYFICESYVFMYLICKHGHLILYHIWKYLIDCLIETVHIWFWKTVCWVNLKVTKCIQFVLTCGSINYQWWNLNREGLITQMVLWSIDCSWYIIYTIYQMGYKFEVQKIDFS